MRTCRAVLFLFLIAVSGRALSPNSVAVQGTPPSASGAVVGVEAATSSSAQSSAGAVGQAFGTAGPTFGVRGVAASPDGVAGLFEANGGGDPILAVNGSGGLFAVDRSGALAASSFVGDGANLVGGPALLCNDCLDSGDLAAGAVGASQLPPNVVSSTAILDGTVNSLKIAPGAVGAGELANGAVGSAAIADRTLTSAHVGTFAVTTAKLAPDTVTSEKLAFGAVSLRKLAGYTGVTMLYQQHTDCVHPGKPTREAACSSRLCSAPNTRFLDCSGNCTATSVQVCTNEATGLMLPATN